MGSQTQTQSFPGLRSLSTRFHYRAPMWMDTERSMAAQETAITASTTKAMGHFSLWPMGRQLLLGRPTVSMASSAPLYTETVLLSSGMYLHTLHHPDCFLEESM